MYNIILTPYELNNRTCQAENSCKQKEPKVAPFSTNSTQMRNITNETIYMCSY